MVELDQRTCGDCEHQSYCHKAADDVLAMACMRFRSPNQEDASSEQIPYEQLQQQYDAVLDALILLEERNQELKSIAKIVQKNYSDLYEDAEAKFGKFYMTQEFAPPYGTMMALRGCGVDV